MPHKVGALVSLIVITGAFLYLGSDRSFFAALTLALGWTAISALMFLLAEGSSRRWRLLIVVGFHFALAVSAAYSEFYEHPEMKNHFPTRWTEYGFGTYMAYLWAVRLAPFVPFIAGVFIAELVQQRWKRRLPPAA